jgi:hypothetical protein
MQPKNKEIKACPARGREKRSSVAIIPTRKHSAVGKQPAQTQQQRAQQVDASCGLPPVGEDESDYGDALSLADESDEGSAAVVLPVDIDDAMIIADSDPSNQAKQALVMRNAVRFEKQFVSLTNRSGKRISAVAFSKGFFKIPTISAEGQELMKRTKKEGGK